MVTVVWYKTEKDRNTNEKKQRENVWLQDGWFVC